MQAYHLLKTIARGTRRNGGVALHTRNEKNRRNRRSRPVRHMTIIEFRAIAFVATLILAGIAIVLHINEPVVWGFLGTSIGIAIGQAAQSKHQR